MFSFVLLQVHLMNGVYMNKNQLANCLAKCGTNSKFIGLDDCPIWRADELLKEESQRKRLSATGQGRGQSQGEADPDKGGGLQSF